MGILVVYLSYLLGIAACVFLFVYLICTSISYPFTAGLAGAVYFGFLLLVFAIRIGSRHD